MEITITMKIEDEELKDLLGLQKEKPKVKVKVRRKSTNPYVRIFDETCAGWRNDYESNRLFLTLQQDYANERLRNRGYLFLNEVYDMLDIPRTKDGQVVGWIYDENNPIGDNYVDFGLLDEPNHEFIHGRKNNVLLNFNVDGNILDRL